MRRCGPTRAWSCRNQSILEEAGPAGLASLSLVSQLMPGVRQTNRGRCSPHETREMTDSASAQPYGGRFFDELRRLTKSTWGLKYADIPRLRAMDRDQVLAELSKLYDLDWILRLDSSSPEGFARAIAREGLVRAKQQRIDDGNPLPELQRLLDFLLLFG
jgi:hypothetical protein